MTIHTPCAKCGAATRLVGIEPHPRLAGSDIWTFECVNCGNSEVATQPLGATTLTGASASAGQTLN